MKVIDPGHRYSIDSLDGDFYQEIQFVKRMGGNYPGNLSINPGTTLQELYRVCADRLRYVDAQKPCNESKQVILLTKEILMILENRAARLHNSKLVDLATAEFGAKCDKCGHTSCLHERGALGGDEEV